MSAQPFALQIITIGVPAAASLLAALWAARSANRARQAESEAARLRQLEERLAEKKFALYEPILTALGELFTPGRSVAGTKRMENELPKFMTFVAMWGSDEAVETFFRYRQAAGSDPQPPHQITLRLVSDFLIAVRHDLSGDQSRITGLEAMGMRITDLYSDPDGVDTFSLPLDALARKHGWTPPWA